MLLLLELFDCCSGLIEEVSHVRFKKERKKERMRCEKVLGCVRGMEILEISTFSIGGCHITSEFKFDFDGLFVVS